MSTHAPANAETPRAETPRAENGALALVDSPWERLFVRFCRVLLPVAIVVAGLVGYRFLTATPEPSAVPLVRNEPWEIRPRYNQPRAVTDRQLYAALRRARPPAGTPNTNIIHHALRMWGPEARFDDPDIPSGRQLQDYFLDDAAFRQWAGEDEPPLFEITPKGVNVRSFERGNDHLLTTSHHVDDVLATLAKAGTPLDATIHTRNGDTTFRELLVTSLRRSYLEQYENEWTMMTYARYVLPLMAWENRYGRTIYAEELVRELMERNPRHGVCYATHRLEALTLLLAADEQAKALPPELHAEIVQHLKEQSRLLVAAQFPQGYWTKYWADGATALEEPQGSQYERLLATGHHLEWLALAPPEVLPPMSVIIRACQWTARAVVEIDDATFRRKYGPISHSARALALWRGMEPFEAWQELNREQPTEGRTR